MPNPESNDPWKSAPSPDDTVRMSTTDPGNPYATQQLNVAKYLEAQNVKLPVQEAKAKAEQTQKLKRPGVDDPPIRIQKVDQPADAAGQTQKLPLEEVPKPLAWKLPLLFGVLVVLGAVIYLVVPRSHAPQPPISSSAAADAPPASLETLLEQAKSGDAHAMRMLGAMYFYGLSVPQDREKGLYWYRKAAEKGSDVARAELNRIEGGR